MPKNTTQAPVGAGNKFGKVGGDAVADDRNWVDRIHNELGCV